MYRIYLKAVRVISYNMILALPAAYQDAVFLTLIYMEKRYEKKRNC